MIIIDKIVDKDFTLIANKPISIVCYECDDGYIEAECDDFNVYCIGINEDSLRKSIEENIVYNWKELAKEKDSNLEINAIEVANNLRKAFVEVPNQNG